MKDRQFTILNLFGLSTGLACTILIYLWVSDEMQVDRFNEKDKQLFQIMMNMETPNGIETGEQTPGLLAQALTKEFPEVEFASSVIPVSSADKTGILSYQGNNYTSTNQFAGKAAFTAQKRQKEIGIRKVVGASTNNVFILLSKDFLKLVLISILIAFPISWWAMYHWLNGFAYRVDLGIDIFVIAATSTMLITIFSISFQSIKAAVMNPIKSLRAE